MPAAAVIPAPLVYIKVVAVKKLVVGFLLGIVGSAFRVCIFIDPGILVTLCGINLLLGLRLLL